MDDRILDNVSWHKLAGIAEDLLSFVVQYEPDKMSATEFAQDCVGFIKKVAIELCDRSSDKRKWEKLNIQIIGARKE